MYVHVHTDNARHAHQLDTYQERVDLQARTQQHCLLTFVLTLQLERLQHVAEHVTGVVSCQLCSCIQLLEHGQTVADRLVAHLRVGPRQAAEDRDHN